VSKASSLCLASKQGLGGRPPFCGASRRFIDTSGRFRTGRCEKINTATVNENGVQITTSQGTSGAKFIDKTPTADINGSGKFEGFSFHIDGSCNGKCLDSGTFKFNGTPDETRNLLDKRGAFRSVVDQTIPGLGHSLDEETFPEHRNTTQHRFGDVPSPPFSVPRDPKSMVPTVGGFHVDTNAPGLQHFGCAVAGVACN
jgi:hypothetical protein